MLYHDFEQAFEDKFGDEWNFIYSLNQDRLKLKNKRIAIKKLAIIIPAVFQISRQQSFHGMTLRDLSLATGISMGGLYKYFSNKEDLIIMIHDALVKMTASCLETVVENDPLKALALQMQYHLYISERLKKWFYFVFMETKHLDKPLLTEFVQSEKLMESAMIKHLITAKNAGLCQAQSPFFTAATLKAILQEWYLKPHKYAHEGITVEQYSELLISTMHRLIGINNGINK